MASSYGFIPFPVAIATKSYHQLQKLQLQIIITPAITTTTTTTTFATAEGTTTRTCTVMTFNSCTECVGSPGRKHNCMQDCQPVSSCVPAM